MTVIIVSVLTTRHAARCRRSGIIQEVQVVMPSRRECQRHVSLHGSPGRRH